MLQDIAQDIEALLRAYLRVRSDSGTLQETHADGFFRDCLAEEPYFRENPGHRGAFPIPGDPLGRSINWALARGEGPGTVVLIHHSDTVGTEDYQHLAGCARDPGALAAALGRPGVELSPEARRDLESGEFLFGHGAADMKAGGAIQLALLKRFSRRPRGAGSLLLLALPDEENLSLGMRQSPALLEILKGRFGLDYRLMINSEPHQRRDPAVTVLSEGSVGKTLPFVYVRGALAHAGQIFAGLNPVSLLSEVVRRVELNADFCDTWGAEVTPPPTCLFMKDSKDRYDVSIPRSAFACFNALTLGRAPDALLALLEAACRASVPRVLEDMDRNHARYRALLGQAPDPLPWSVPVLRFEQIPRRGGAESRSAEIVAQVRAGARTMPQGTWDLVEALLDQAGSQGPAIVIGFVPPYYPAVTNAGLGDPGHRAMALAGHLVRRAAARGQACVTEPFYTGISDLSYSSIQQGPELERALVPNMPLHGPAYSVPFAAIRGNAMPCINIGPWGKDFHRLTERVHKHDLLEATPRLLLEAVRFMLDMA